MAVKKKGLRKVKYKDRIYYWRVEDIHINLPDNGFVDEVQNGRMLHIISADKKFIVHYRIPQPGDSEAELRVEGPLFPRAPGQKVVYIPRWRHDSKRYPTADFVRRLIDYCYGAQ